MVDVTETTPIGVRNEKLKNVMTLKSTTSKSITSLEDDLRNGREYFEQLCDTQAAYERALSKLSSE